MITKLIKWQDKTEIIYSNGEREMTSDVESKLLENGINLRNTCIAIEHLNKTEVETVFFGTLGNFMWAE